MDSLADKFTFIPSDPQIAHVISEIIYEAIDCQKVSQGNIRIGNAGFEQGPEDYCPPFDWDDNYNYCDGHSDSNLFVVGTSAGGTFYEQADYQVRMTILTDGVYWTNEVVRADGYDTVDDACSDRGPSNWVGNPYSGNPDEAYMYFDAEGDPASPVDLDSSWSDCVFEEEAVTLLTACDSDVVNRPGVGAVSFDIPRLKYNLDEISLGDEVMVTITLIKCPCGETWTETLNLGRLGCDIEEVFDTWELLYPYGTALGGDDWWDGFVMINIGNNDGMARLNFYEKDGDTASMVIAIPSKGMFVDTLFNIWSAPAGGMIIEPITQTGGTGVIGDSQLYIVACSNFRADGFLFMGDWTISTKKGQSMGYLPRLTIYGLCGSFPSPF
jgi:hypothetical protein